MEASLKNQCLVCVVHPYVICSLCNKYFCEDCWSAEGYRHHRSGVDQLRCPITKENLIWEDEKLNMPKKIPYTLIRGEQINDKGSA